MMIFRTPARATLAAMLLLTPPALAQETSTGLLMAGSAELEFGGAFLDESNDESENETGDQNYPFLAGAGVFSLPVLETLSVQTDVSGEYAFPRSGSDNNTTGQIVAGGHLSLRDPGMGLVGVFGGYARGWNEDDDTPFAQDESSAGWIGIEGQAYLGAATAYLQAAYVNGEVENTEETYNPAFVVRGAGRYFFGEDRRVQLDLAYTQSQDVVDGDDDMRAFGWGVRYDQRLMGALHGFVGYRGNHYDTSTEGEELTEHMPSIGVSWLFGAPTLLANDRQGATLDQPLLPLRATNWAQPLD